MNSKQLNRIWTLGKMPASLAVVVLVLSGCGGGSGDSTASHPGASLKSSNVTTPKVVSHEQLTSDRRVHGMGTEFDNNSTGTALTLSLSGPIDRTGLFFQPFGNGRSCASCHRSDQGWSITPDGMKKLYDASAGKDPVFSMVDGSNRPDADVSTDDKRRAAFNMLLNRGVIRVGIGMPANAEFDLTLADDPYGFASAKELSLFRRPQPATNLRFESTVMWDGRETALISPDLDDDDDNQRCVGDGAAKICYAPLIDDLAHQANSAVKGHAQALTDLTQDQRMSIARFERSLYTAQVSDTAAGSLYTNGAMGGTVTLLFTESYWGINDFAKGDYVTGQPFNQNVMQMYGKWANASKDPSLDPAVAARRESIARGEVIFNTRPIVITGVNGLNDVLKMPTISGTCSTCHTMPNIGTHSVPAFMNIGVANAARRPTDPTVAMPLYTFQNKLTGEVIKLLDPGLALQTGKWSDLGKFKVPNLRGLAARPPYFHDGSFADIPGVIHFYDRQFKIGFSEQEKTDLGAFLSVL